MYKTEFNGKQYVFSDDRLFVNGIPIPYSEMSNIAHRSGDVPAFVFTFKGKRFALSYHPEEMKSILPYFLQAEKALATSAQSLQPAGRTAATTTESYFIPEPEPSVASEPAIPEPYTAAEPTIPEPVASEQEPYVASEPVIPEPDAASEPGAFESYDAYEPYDAAESETPDSFDMDESYDADAPYDNTEAEGIDPYDVSDDMSDPEAIDPLLITTPVDTVTPIVEQEKRFLTKGKLIAGIVCLVIVLAVIIFACIHKGGDSDAQDPANGQDAVAAQDDDAMQDEYAASDEDAEPLPNPNDVVEATDGFTVTDFDGTIDAKLKNVYVGDDALKKLTDMGENAADFQEEGDPSYQTIVYEYEVTPTDGMLIGDPITGEPYLSDKKTELEDYWSYDLEANADKDLTLGELELKKGTTTTVYCVYGMPKDLKEYYEKVYVDTDDKTIWVHYDLK